MTLPLLELRRFNGVETFAVETATCNGYLRDGMTEAVFVVTTSKSVASLPDTKGLRAIPHLEIGFRTNISLSEVFATGARYSGLPEYDDTLDEWMTNIYYCEHQGVDNITVAIEASDSNSIIATIEGTTTDVNHYDGSKPDTIVRVRAVFRKKATLEKSFG